MSAISGRYKAHGRDDETLGLIDSQELATKAIYGEAEKKTAPLAECG
jgi:hypothetical protein